MKHKFCACETVTYCIPDDCLRVPTPYSREEKGASLTSENYKLKC